MVVGLLMGDDVVAAETIEAFEANEQAFGMGLRGEGGTGSVKHLTHWSL